MGISLLRGRHRASGRIRDSTGEGKVLLLYLLSPTQRSEIGDHFFNALSTSQVGLLTTYEKQTWAEGALKEHM